MSCQLVDICILFNLTIDHHLRSLRFCDFLVVSHSPDQLLICSQYEEWNFFVFGENSKHKIGIVKNECTTFQQHFFIPRSKCTYVNQILCVFNLLIWSHSELCNCCFSPFETALLITYDHSHTFYIRNILSYQQLSKHFFTYLWSSDDENLIQGVIWKKVCIILYL